MAPSSSCVLLRVLALTSVLLTAVYVIDMQSTTKLTSACDMTWSWPVYSLVTWRAVPSHPKYQLYRVDMKSARESLAGVPVLFVPGHMGSYTQARSLSRHLWDTNETGFDLFALDFGEEPTALNGKYITEQATFVNDVVRGILREYKRREKKVSNSKRVLPTSVIFVAHSMGGIVARTAAILPNYKKQSIQHVIALGVPYEMPAFSFDTEINAVYDRMHLKSGKEDDVVYVSIAGGHKDTLVETSWTNLNSVALSSRSFVVLASAIPTVKTSVDHFALLWCHQLLKVVAKSLHRVIDVETRTLVKSPSVRLAIVQQVLLAGSDAPGDGDIPTALNISMHQEYVQIGYHPEEYAGYALLLPQYGTKFLRSNLTTVIVMMYALALHIFYAQVAHWQSSFNQQSASCPDHLSNEKFPSFTSMLNPSAHVPALFKKGLGVFSSDQSTLYTGKMMTAVATGFTLAMVVGFKFVGYHTFLTSAITIAELIILYAYALGLLYTLSKFFSFLQCYILSPIVSCLAKVTGRLQLRGWMLIFIVHGIAQLVGHVTSTLSVNFSRILGLLVLVSFLIFVLKLVSLCGGNCYGNFDHQRMNRSLFAVLCLSIFPWIGKIVYMAGIVRLPPSKLSNELLLEGGSYVVMLNVFTYLITLSHVWMIPRPPTAFFGASEGYEETFVNGASNVTITAENCPKCFYEDAGPGAVLVEYHDQTTRRMKAGKGGEFVYVGPTFRVVSCDCVYRLEISRDFCAFCTRSCRLCGGGNANYEEAAKYKEFLQKIQVDVAMHALVPITFQLCAALQVTYGISRAHLSFYLTPACVLALIIYHVGLRHPLEVRHMKSKQRKKATRKRKCSRKSKKNKSSGTSTDGSSTARQASSIKASKDKETKRT
ncbi:hypothetical protein PsorP6_000402 [Peronosclerospora sorghi]|uniref:Uncharacterized protein n=1 Tax=Peronosclerospora sorghi TaxID=230839 RepID=A0ACC0WUL0_9STRA|nr:hypothetical protein PsorP6_000402 [Peronosclerospora sorghi]